MITCQACGGMTHVIQRHLEEAHAGLSLEQYEKMYPAAPLLSAHAKTVIDKALRRREAEAAAQGAHSNVVPIKQGAPQRKPLADVFRLGNNHLAKNGLGDDLMIRVFQPSRPQDVALIPSVDSGYVYDVNLLRLCIMAVELKINPYLWGHAGVGKSTIWEQICARTGRPMIRMQHNRLVEPHQIVGQMAASKELGTYFEPGPLAMAMKYGWVYLADEYDTMQPGCLMVYQAVLEHKPLVIPDAPEEWRRIEPHPDFFFAATGNTNGSGDETDLYSGTLTQNYANYTRFGLVERVTYMDPRAEAEMIKVKTGIDEAMAKKLVEYATMVREAFEKKDMSTPIGPRELLDAATISHNLDNYPAGLMLAFGNKLRGACGEKARELAIRVFDDPSTSSISKAKSR